MWAGIAAGAGAIGGALISSKGASSASREQAEATRAGITEQRLQFDMSREDLAPYRSAGKSALSRLTRRMGQVPNGGEIDESDPRYQQLYQQIYAGNDAEHQRVYGIPMNASPDVQKNLNSVREQTRGAFVRMFPNYASEAEQAARSDPAFDSLNKKFTMEDFQNDPVTKASFDFGMSEGEKAVQRMFGARGLSRSGAAVKAASRFATDYTGTKAGESYGRFYADQDRTFNREAAVAGIGQTATTNTASLGAQTSGNVANMLTAEGNARGAAAIARSNAMGGAVNQVGNQIYGQYTLDRILRPGGGVTNSPGAGAPSFTMDSYVPDASRVVT
jgi:hypothetical protein